jgi:hypothetical protein
MKTLAAVVLTLVVFGNVAQADDSRTIAGEKVVESKEVKAQRAKDRKEHEKFLQEITRSR